MSDIQTKSKEIQDIKFIIEPSGYLTIIDETKVELKKSEKVMPEQGVYDDKGFRDFFYQEVPCQVGGLKHKYTVEITRARFC